jgi:hypothetical protein
MRRLVDIAFALAALAASDAGAQTTEDRCDNCGRVQSVKLMAEQTTSWRPLGSVSPGSITGDFNPGRTTTTFAIGPQGRNDGIVILGAAGGAAYAKRPQAYERQRWEIVIKMDSGVPRTIQTDYDPLLQEGDRVRVYGTQLELVP